MQYGNPQALTRTRPVGMTETTRVLKAKLRLLDPYVSVARGRGTASRWIDVMTSLPPDVVRGVAKDLEARELIFVPKYPDDMDDTWHDCLTIKPRKQR